MAKRIKVDGVIHSFPDDATDAEINAALPAQGGGNRPAQAPQPGLLSRAWNTANTPVADNFAGQNSTAKEVLNKSTAGLLDYDAIRKSQASGPSEADSSSPTLYGLKQGYKGAMADTADTLAGFTSPVSLATAGLGLLGKGAGAVAKIGQMATKAIGTGFALKGAADVADAATNSEMSTPDRWQKGLQGGGMMAGGTAGAINQTGFGNVPIQKAPVRLWQDASNAVMKRVLPGSPQDLLVRATKPNVGLPDYEQSLTNSLPALAAEKPTSLTGLASAADKVKGVEYGKYQSLMDQFRKPQGAGPYNPTQVDARPAADAQMASIPATDLFEKPNQQRVIQRGGHQIHQGDAGILEKTKGIADLYRTDMPVEQADSIVRDSNAKLRETWNKIGGKRASALSNPETARLYAMDNSLRGQLYDTIEKGTGVNPSKGMELYGDATDIGDTAARRNTVFSRQQPVSLQEGIVGPLALTSPAGAAAWTAGKLFKKLNNSDFQVKTAFDRYGLDQRQTPKSKFPYGSLAAAVAARKR